MLANTGFQNVDHKHSVELENRMFLFAAHLLRICTNKKTLLLDVSKNSVIYEVPEVGLEPTQPCGHRILNPTESFTVVTHQIELSS